MRGLSKPAIAARGQVGSLALEPSGPQMHCKKTLNPETWALRYKDTGIVAYYTGPLSLGGRMHIRVKVGPASAHPMKVE